MSAVLFLGKSGAGKTSLIRQFLYGQFDEGQQATRRPQTHRPFLVLGDKAHPVKIVDLPAIRRWPTNSLEEWQECRGYGLRSATLFVLVYDVSDEESFVYLRSLRDQILSQSSTPWDVRFLVVANKAERVPEERRREQQQWIRKAWKCSAVECSARCNWKVSSAFREMLQLCLGAKDAAESSVRTRVHDALRSNRCSVM